jgi:hypothetical protein
VTENHGVGGSIPPLGTIKIKHLRDNLSADTLPEGNTRGNDSPQVRRPIRFCEYREVPSVSAARLTSRRKAL